MRVGVLVSVLVAGCGFGLTGTKDVAEADSAAVDDGPPPTEVTVEGLLYGIGGEDFTLVAPAAAAGFVDELFTYDVLMHVDAERPDSLALSLSLAGADGYQNPCEPIVPLPKAEWTDPVFRAGPGDIATTLGGAPVTLRDFTLSGTFAPDAFTWSAGELLATFDAREVDAALPDGLHACDLLDAMSEACIPCGDGEVVCFDLHLVDITASLVSWPFDTTPDGTGC